MLLALSLDKLLLVHLFFLALVTNVTAATEVVTHAAVTDVAAVVVVAVLTATARGHICLRQRNDHCPLSPWITHNTPPRPGPSSASTTTTTAVTASPSLPASSLPICLGYSAAERAEKASLRQGPSLHKQYLTLMG